MHGFVLRNLKKRLDCSGKFEICFTRNGYVAGSTKICPIAWETNRLRASPNFWNISSVKELHVETAATEDRSNIEQYLGMSSNLCIGDQHARTEQTQNSII